MKFLIIGVNGFLGAAIAARLTSNGAEVFGLSRSASPGCELHGHYLVADRGSPSAVLEIVERCGIDVIVDVLAMTLADTQPLLFHLDGRVARYVMLSSADVYRNYELLHRSAEGPPNLQAINEHSDLRGSRYPYRADPPRAADAPDRFLDDYDKIPIEAAVQQLTTAWTILRLPMVYGPGDRQRRFRWAVQHMAERSEPLTIPRPWAEWITTYGYVENVAAAIVLAAGDAGAANRVFNIGEVRSVNHLQWARRLAAVMEWRGGIEISDDPTSVFASRLTGLDLSVPFRIDDDRIRRELEFREPVAMADGLARTVAHERSRLAAAPPAG